MIIHAYHRPLSFVRVNKFYTRRRGQSQVILFPRLPRCQSTVLLQRRRVRGSRLSVYVLLGLIRDIRTIVNFCQVMSFVFTVGTRRVRSFPIIVSSRGFARVKRPFPRGVCFSPSCRDILGFYLEGRGRVPFWLCRGTPTGYRRGGGYPEAISQTF